MRGALAVTLGKQRNKGPPPPTPPPRSRVGSQAAFLDTAGGSSSDLRAPLLAEDPAPAVSDASDADIVAGVCVDDAPGASDDFDPSAYAPSPEDQLYNQRAVRRRDVIVELTFLCCVAMQAYVAVKSVAFYYDPEHTARTAVLFGVVIVCVNAQSVHFRQLVSPRAAIRHGAPWPETFTRELQFHDRVVGHVCDMCGLRLVAGSKGLRFGGFRCKTCDFDCCMRCFSRKNRDTARGGRALVRQGSKGAKTNPRGVPCGACWRWPSSSGSCSPSPCSPPS